MTLLSSIASYSQKITRGPDIGEIYFLGPSYTTDGLYYSTDFGETAICVDSINNFASIAADPTPGGIYCITYPITLYYSSNFGYTNNWEFKYAGIDLSIKINSGTELGHIFSGCYMHSENYGVNYFYHTLNGYFGNPWSVTIDNVNENIGYVITYKLSVSDTLYYFRTIDKYENLELLHKLYVPNGEYTHLSTGNETGIVYLYYRIGGVLIYSNNFAGDFIEVDKFNFKNYYSFDIIGGRQIGEMFILYNFVNLMWQNAHTYIFHSTDYGNTFEVFHPFSKGNEPVLANFSTVEKEIIITEPVEFSNYSIGDIIEYQWDFENDGIIDSYNEFPTYIYQDTGCYSIKLSVVGQDSTNTFIKENYIHVIDTITNIPDFKYQNFNIYPNPFNDNISIEIRKDFKKIEIYDLNGKSHFTKTIDQRNKTEIIDLKGLEKGIYILKIRTDQQDITKKIIKI